MSDHYGPMRVTFRFDGTGVCHDTNNPTHLDGLLVWCMLPDSKRSESLTRDEQPEDIILPLERWHSEDPKAWGWRASALFPDGQFAETRFHRRRKMQMNRLERTTGTVNTQIGTMKEWNVPVPVLLCHTLVAFAVGDRLLVERLLRDNIRYVGRERARGFGRVVGIDVDATDGDWSCVRNSACTRYLPDRQGERMVRPRPPYWNIADAVPHKDVGEPAPEWTWAPRQLF